MVGSVQIGRILQGQLCPKVSGLRNLGETVLCRLSFSSILVRELRGQFLHSSLLRASLGLPFGQPLLFGASDALLITKSLLTACGIGSSKSISSFFDSDPGVASTKALADVERLALQ